MGFSENLKEIRKSRGMTQKQLAEKLGIRRQTVVDWENNKGNGPDFINLKALVTTLEVSWNRLMEGEVEQVKIDFPQWKKENGMVVVLRALAKTSGALYEQIFHDNSREEVPDGD